MNRAMVRQLMFSVVSVCMKDDEKIAQVIDDRDTELWSERCMYGLVCVCKNKREDDLSVLE